METVLFWAVVAVVIVGWILFRKRRKSRGGAGEQEQVSQEITISISSDQDYDNYEVLEVNKSRSSSQEYELVRHRSTGHISCSCPGFTYAPDGGCIHTNGYIDRHKTDEDDRSIELGGVVRQLSRRSGQDSGGTRRKGNAHQKQTLETLAQWADSNYLILDTETTRLTDKSRIVEVAIIDKQGEVLLNTLVNPGRTPIQAAAAKIHGITRDDVRDKPTFTELWPQLSAILDAHDLVLAYNADFDFRLMQQSLEDEDAVRSLNRVPKGCVMETYTNWWRLQGPQNKSTGYRSLSDAAKECRVRSQADTHRAVEDCEVARQVLVHMIENLPGK